MDVLYTDQMNPVGTDASVQCEWVTEVYKVILGAQLLVAICPKGRAQFECCVSCNKKSYGFNLYVPYAGKD